MSSAVTGSSWSPGLVGEERITLEKFLTRHGDERAEFVDGRVIPMAPPGEFQADIAANLVWKLKNFVYEHKLGRVYVELSCLLPVPGGMVRVPDVSFIEVNRLDPNRDRRRAFQGAPTLAVEILSPSDTLSELQDKAALYLSVGTRVVWLIEPEERRVTVRTSEGSAVLFDDDILEAPEILPGFKISITELFDD